MSVEMTDASAEDEIEYTEDVRIPSRNLPQPMPAGPYITPTNHRNWSPDKAAGEKRYKADLNDIFSLRLSQEAKFTPITAGKKDHKRTNKEDLTATIAANSHHTGAQSMPKEDPEPLEFHEIFATTSPPKPFARTGRMIWPKIYEIIQQKYDMYGSHFLAQGGEGTVNLAREHATGRVYAIKLIRHRKYFETGQAPNEIERLESIGLGPKSGVEHANILKIVDWFPPADVDTGQCACVTEFCPLDDLEKFTWAHFHGPWNKNARPHEALLRSLYIDLLQGLEFLHATQTAGGAVKPALIHGDIKPQNVLLAPNHALPGHWAYAVPTAKLADFGGATARPIFDEPPPLEFESQADRSTWSQSNRHIQQLRQIYTQDWAPPQALPHARTRRFDAHGIVLRLRPSTDVYSVAASIGFVLTSLPAKKGGGFQEKKLTSWTYKNRGYDKGDEWWERNLNLVTRNEILPPAARSPEGSTLDTRRAAWPAARARNTTTPPFEWPDEDYSVAFMTALKKGFEPDIEQRPDVQTLLGWLRAGFEGYVHDLIYGEGGAGTA